MALPPLDDDRLHVLVFGPGIGELVLVRAPPDSWLVIDGCSSDGEPYGQRVLEHYKATPKAIVFTHPHLDHARGVADVVDAATTDSRETWPRLGMLPILQHLVERPTGGRDPAADFERGVTEQAVAAILDRWERHPPCRWDVGFGAEELLGEARIKVISPAPMVADRAEQKLLAAKRFDWNTVSTALLLEWRGRRILLGSDLVEQPLQGWSRAARLWWDELSRFDAAKVPHHGSARALDRNLLTGPAVGIVTPFATKGLPRFDAGEGLEQLISRRFRIFLTGLPRAHSAQAGSPMQLSRAAFAPDPLIRCVFHST